METVKEVFDPETGYTFHYTFDNFGWSIRLSPWFFENERTKAREILRRATLLAPEVPVECKAQVELENRKLRSLTSGSPWPGDENE